MSIFGGISISGLFAIFSFGAFVYLIVALQLHNGFPPFYKLPREERELDLNRGLELGFLLLFLMMLAVWKVFFLYLFGIAAAWMGFLLRRSVKRHTNGPALWLATPMTLPIFNRWPMLLFDLWSIGNAAVMVAVMTWL